MRRNTVRVLENLVKRPQGKISHEEAVKEWGRSISDFYTAINDLEKRGMIGRTRDGFYLNLVGVRKYMLRVATLEKGRVISERHLDAVDRRAAKRRGEKGPLYR